MGSRRGSHDYSHNEGWQPQLNSKGGRTLFQLLTVVAAANIAISFNNKIFGQHGEWILHLEDSRIERDTGREGERRLVGKLLRLYAEIIYDCIV